METNRGPMARMCLDASVDVTLIPRSLGAVVGEEVHLLVNMVFVVLLWPQIDWRRGLFRSRFLVLVPNKVHLPRRRRKRH